MSHTAGRLLIRAYGDRRDPAEVSNTLGMQPTSTQVAGAPSHFPELGPIPASSWFLEVEISADIEEAARTLRDTVTTFAQRIGAVRALAERGWEFDVVIAPAPQSPYLVIPSEVVKDLASLGVSTAIELWSHDRYDS